MKLGIVGSSYSVGSHRDSETNVVLAKPFESWFGDIDLINSACASKGTELYLNKVLYLKKQHNIDTLLMEVINNRSMLNVKTQLNNYKVIWEESNVDNIINDVYKDSISMHRYQRCIHQEIDYTEFGTKKEYNLWKRFQESIAADGMMNEFWALIDMRHTIELCELLDIKVVAWANRWHMEKIPVFDSVIGNQTYIKFGDFMNAHDYYANKYDKENILCDYAHFKDEINKEMIEDFILPKIGISSQCLTLTK
jgi:hypothetical protein